ncbi:MAG TPA: hypothetical protein LFW21_00020 [Rickettsia endosymbiont of Pyrocoelia pectoralis]|nr:hypothetical protein [Rickettsia endosymbiont of Pyrocoelia pectoralis]
MSNQFNQTIYNNLLNSTGEELIQLEKELLLLLEKPVTKEEIDRIENRLKELEKVFYKDL